VQEVIIQGYPHYPISLAFVWTNMLPPDNEAAAASSARLIQDSRAQHFYDPNALAGKAVAASLGSPDAIAWDIYLFYPSGLQWQQEPPTPVEWAHQLSDPWIDPKHYHWKDDLVRELKRVMARLSGSNTLDK
jgi:hypothetical protein